MPVPVVEFTDERLPNGLRLIVVEDHLAPVVAVNIWYNVGSKHEVPGKTGFAHLFEHVMFQGIGARRKGRAHGARPGRRRDPQRDDLARPDELLRDAAVAPAGARDLCLEADRMGSLLDALSQENLDNQREVVKNEKRWSYDNRPYGTWNEKLLGPPVPRGAPVPPPDDRLDGGPRRRLGRRRQGVLPRRSTRPNNAVLSRRRATATGRRCARWAEQYFGPIPANPRSPAAARHVAAGADRRRAPRDGRGPRPAAARVHRVPGAGLRRLAGSTPSTSPRSCWPAARGAGCTGGSSARSGWPRTSRCSRCRSSAARRSSWAGRRSGRASTSRPSRRPTSRSWSGSRRRRRSTDELERAKALTEADELGALARVEERADRLSMYATLFDDPGLINTLLPRYLSVTAEQIRDAAREVFRADNRVVLTYVPQAADAPGQQH